MRGGGSPDRGLTRLEQWVHYFGGMVTEVFYIAVLAMVALAIAVLAEAVF